MMHIAIDKLFALSHEVKRSELLILLGAGEFLKGKILTVVFCNRYYIKRNKGGKHSNSLNISQ
jgi:hypothetical protein